MAKMTAKEMADALVGAFGKAKAGAFARSQEKYFIAKAHAAPTKKAMDAAAISFHRWEEVRLIIAPKMGMNQHTVMKRMRTLRGFNKARNAASAARAGGRAGGVVTVKTPK